MEEIINEFQLISDNQFEFVKRRITSELLKILYSKANNALNNLEILAVCFLDLSKAYDNVDINILKYILNSIGIRGNMQKYLDNFLSERCAAVRVKSETSNYKFIELGVPQGSLLSPTLYYIYTADLIKKQKRRFAFADDFMIIVEAKKLS